MKKGISILLMLCLSSLIRAQVFNNAYNNFNHVFTTITTNEDIYNYDGFGDCLILDDTIYCYGWSSIAETFLDTQKLGYTYLVKLNKNGDTISVNEFLIASNELSVIGSPIQINQDNFTCFGYTRENYYSNNDIALIVHHDKDLIVTNYDTLLLSENTGFVSAETFSDSSFLVIANTDTDTSNNTNYDYHILEIDTSNSVLRNIIFGGTDDDLLNGFVIKSNGNILLSGITLSLGAGDEDIHLMEIDTSGNILWENTYGYPGTDILSWKGCIVDDSGNIYLSGWTELNTGNKAGWLVKTDSVGSIIWEKKFDRGQYFDGFVGVNFSQDGNIILSGSTHNYDVANAPATGWLLKVDTVGEIIWQRFPSRYQNMFNTHDYINRLEIDERGYLYVSGYILRGITTNNVYHANDAWLCKMDSCGFTTGAEPEAWLTIESITDYTAYISNLSTEYCTAKLYIYDAQGSSIDSINIYAYSDWTSGVNPNQLQYTFSDTGTYNLTLLTFAGDGIDTFSTQVVINDTISSIPELSRFNFSIFPNPSLNYFIVEGNWEQASDLSCEMYTISGQYIQSYALDPKRYQQRVVFSNLSNGIYLLHFTSKGSSLGFERLSVVK